ncbi:hypothetical protein, variant [Blastomyces dermatitidis ATCC 18188]|uniref:Uncharacterized protein n=1 Tax=Ajellomyces dermatitidis (strain ATCC 18188 / CBS 674.68) TaxID=653446 RepID=F2T7V9_AJEDA|nr:hypothetical protein BDDG_02261 [Blastomyces dermatitidis ATCC 18188]KMW66973.1 hypothetical protein, variant [Blastomyces dermatitidis ATCC 18188]
MPPSVWTASLEPEQGVLASLSHWISSLFKMLAISLNPKPPHIQSPDSDDSPPDDASTRSESINSFTPAPPPPPAASTSVSSSPLPPPQQESQTPPDTLVKPPVPPPISTSTSHASSNGSRRPKLSLQTSSLPMTFGKSTTALSLALSAGCSQSPTVRNTFSNAYDGFRRPPSSSTTGASSPKCSSRAGKRTSSYLCSYQGVDDEIPYKLPLGLRSILRNSPLLTSASLRRAPLAAQGSNGSVNGHSGRRVFFPAKRQVKYRCPLDEEIKTTRYTAKHSDLLSLDSPSGPSDVYTSSDESEESDSSPSQPRSSSFSDDDEPIAPPPAEENTRNNIIDRNASEDGGGAVKNNNPSPAAVERPRTAKRKHSTSERQIRAVALRDDLASSGSSAYGYRDDTPKTSLLHQRRKRQRKWRWTLGPIENGTAQQVNDINTNSSNSPDPDVAATVTAPDLATSVTASNSAPEPKLMAVPTLRCPSPKRRPSPLVNTTTHPCIDPLAPPQDGFPQGPMCDILHEASSLPLPESLGSSPFP